MRMTRKLFLTSAAVIFLVTFWVPSSPASPMHAVNRFSGNENLQFTSGGSALAPDNTRLSYRLIQNTAAWERIWGYLYSDVLQVDFTRHVVLAIYRSPANGEFTIRPRRVELNDDRLSVDVDVAWNGREEQSHPFLFLVVPRFQHLFVEERFHVPSGREIRYP